MISWRLGDRAGMPIDRRSQSRSRGVQFIKPVCDRDRINGNLQQRRRQLHCLVRQRHWRQIRGKRDQSA
jgi:hypothetical protein